MRSLSPEEVKLWGRVTATIRPLSRESPQPQTTEKPEEIARTTVSHGIRQSAHPVGARATLRTTLDASWDRRLRSGAVEPDRTLDLHGMNLDRAWQAIDRGLEQAIARGEWVVLLITGHHRPGEPPVERGRIRAAVHDWLAASRHAPSIAAVRGASRRHGGGGSLYLVLRRR